MSKTDGKREVILSPHSGFCFGVKRAINIAEEVKGDKVFTCGPLIHNKRVTEDLRQKGIGQVSRLAEAPEGATIIIRSHGEPRAFYEDAAAYGLTLVDATCPFVSRIHDLVSEASEKGMPVLIVGSPDHPEVTATKGWAGEHAYVASSGEEAAGILRQLSEEEAAVFKNRHLFVVAQTTIRKEVFDEVLAVLEEQGIPCEVQNTICNATAERQQGCRETASKVDAMIVIGTPVRHAGRLYNCAIVIRNGGIKGIVPKIYLPTYAEFDEGRWFASGSDFLAPSNTRVGRFVDERGGKADEKGRGEHLGCSPRPGSFFHAC